MLLISYSNYTLWVELPQQEPSSLSIPFSYPEKESRLLNRRFQHIVCTSLIAISFNITFRRLPLCFPQISTPSVVPLFNIRHAKNRGFRKNTGFVSVRCRTLLSSPRCFLSDLFSS
nr:hypothetical protein [Solanum melongena]WMB97080.1 hypothetical protein [Solanum aethiopicum]